MKAPLNNSLRSTLLRLAQFINRKTTWISGLKNRLGIRQFAERYLVKRLTAQEISVIRQNLHTDLIEQKVRDIQKSGNGQVNFYILLVQSIGDIIANEPLTRYLKTLSPSSTIHWIVNKDFQAILEANPYIDELLPVKNLAEGEELCKNVSNSSENIVIDCHFNGIVFDARRKAHQNLSNPDINIYTYYYFGPLLSSFSLAAGCPPLNSPPVFYLRSGVKRPDFGVSEYVVFHCHSNESTRDWLSSKWNRLAKSLTDKGITVVEIGTKRTIHKNYNRRVIDHTGQKDLHELATIIKDAKLFIGIDSAFGHMANCFRTPSVIILGRYKHFDAYLPYSGPFPNTVDFKIIRAPSGQSASHVDFSSVLSAANETLSRTTQQ